MPKKEKLQKNKRSVLLEKFYVQAINTMIAKTQLTGIYNGDQRNRELQKIRRYYSQIKELLRTEEYRGLKSTRAEKRTYVTPPVTS